MSKNSTKPEIAQLLNSVAQQIEYDAGRFGKYTYEELKAEIARENQSNRYIAAIAKPVVSTRQLNCLLPIFRNLLEEFIDEDTDRIGNGVVNLLGGIPHPLLQDYVQTLIRASAALGGGKVAELVFGWIDGEPVKYRVISLLSGVNIDNPLELNEGLQLYKLPSSSNELAMHLPLYSLQTTHGIIDLLGSVALSIECKFSPALYLPSQDEPFQNNVRHTWAGGQMKNLSVDNFCEAMSLASGGCVRWKLLWTDIGEYQEFCDGLGGVSMNDVPKFSGAVDFTQENFDQAREIHNLRNSMKQHKPKLDTAIRRWIRSKSSESLFSDKLIDLRIALETLYLDNSEGELRFRLASYGAWHLSEDIDERKQNFKTLQQVYKLASNAVHGGKIESNDRSTNLLENAQDLCQKGIMKRLREEVDPKWGDLIMGDYR